MKRSLAAAGALGFALFLSACSSAGNAETPASSPAQMTQASTAPAQTMSPPASAAATADIVETAQQAGDFTTLTTAIKAAGLEDDLKGPGPFTVFAPTDEAFAALSAGTVDELLKEPTGQLAEILQYHVVPGEVKAAQVVGLNGQKVTTLQGAELTVEVKDGKVALVDAAGNRVNVVATDVQASNGVIHVIDGVMMPTA